MRETPGMMKAMERTTGDGDRPRPSSVGTMTLTVATGMTDDDANDSQALTGGDITRYRALVARISYLSQDPPDLKFASMQVCCAMTKPTVCDM